MARAGPKVISMRTDALMTLAQWLSPAFPTGAFAYSQGLESAIRDGWVTDAAGLQDWLAVLLTQGTGRHDAILIASAHRAAKSDLADLADLAAAFGPSSERRAETLMQGAAFAATLRAVWRLDLPDMALPVAVGRAARLADLPPVSAAQLYLLSMVTGLVQAAQRLMPLGQTAAQGVIAALAPIAACVADQTATLGPDDLGSAAFGIDIAAMRHETLSPRIFRS
jgi:urease accessory protein